MSKTFWPSMLIIAAMIITCRWVALLDEHKEDLWIPILMGAVAIHMVRIALYMMKQDQRV